MSLLHWDKAFALEQAADDAELLAELLQIFKESLRSDIALIEAGINENSSLKVAGAAHSIKGAAASLGLTGVKQVARVIEEDSRGGSFSAAKEQLQSLHKMLIEVQNL
jgi:HPt (histidine-containing phosphotransfer) domain-containing protein